MFLYYYSCLILLITWILLWIGSLINPMGASLACLDWFFLPICNGKILPLMVSEVFFEHSHRFIASLVGVLTTIFIVNLLISKHFKNKTLYCVTYLTLLSQGILGGTTVLLGLNFVTSVVHLINALIFLCLLIEIQNQLFDCSRIFIFKKKENFLCKFVLFSLIIQVFLGGILRHTGSGMVCGGSILFCGDKKIPNSWLGFIHLIHRLLAYALFLFSSLILLKTNNNKKENAKHARLLILQLIIGFWIIFSVRSAYVVSMHTALAAIILGVIYRNTRLIECKFNLN